MNMFLVEHCVPLMAWGAAAFAAGILLMFASYVGLVFVKALADAEYWAAIPLCLVAVMSAAISVILVGGGKVSFLLGVLGCVLSCFVKG